MSDALKPRHIPIRPDWLALRHEAAIDPEQRIIDAHHHLWDKPGNRFLPADLIAGFEGHRVLGTVFVEGKEFYRTEGPPENRSLGETETIAALAESAAPPGAIATGIVGCVDLTLGAAAGPLIDGHVAAAKGRFCGVRHTTAWHADPEARGSVILPDPGLSYDPGFRAGLAELATRGLVFDAWMYHTQLGELCDLAAALPDLEIVLNHMGGPIGIGPYATRRGEVFADWQHFLRRLTAFKNIRVKLGGFGMLMSGFDFHEAALPPSSDQLAEGWGPYMRTCIELFGAERCMFESNFPVDRGTASYGVIWNAFKKIAAAFPAADRERLFFGTAVQAYRLKVPAPE